MVKFNERDTDTPHSGRGVNPPILAQPLPASWQDRPCEMILHAISQWALQHPLNVKMFPFCCKISNRGRYLTVTLWQKPTGWCFYAAVTDGRSRYKKQLDGTGRLLTAQPVCSQCRLLLLWGCRHLSARAGGRGCMVGVQGPRGWLPRFPAHQQLIQTPRIPAPPRE